MNYDEMPNYDEDAVKPMRQELVQVGFNELKTADSVDEFLGGEKGTRLLVINSVCGCAAGGARPGVTAALQADKIPDQMGTVFAGQDKRAVARVRELLTSVPPSSPFIALFKDGQPVHVMQRHDIEGKDASTIARELTDVFGKNCEAQGPSIPREEFEKMSSIQACGSTIPQNTIKIEGMGDAPRAGGHESSTDEEQPGKKNWWQPFK